MHRKNKYLILCISLFLISFINVSGIPNVDAQTTLQTFEENPITYWNISDEVSATYNSNNTISIKSSLVSSYWYNFEWTKRKTIFLNGSIGAGTNYQIPINVTYDSDMQPDFDDIRFCDNDYKTLLDFWLETKIDSYWALFWVKITDSLETNNYIYQYYGNNGVASTSNGNNVFLFFDDFNDASLHAKWTIAAGAPVESGGVLTCTGTNQEGVYSDDLFTYGRFRSRSYITPPSAGTYGGRIGFIDPTSWGGADTKTGTYWVRTATNDVWARNGDADTSETENIGDFDSAFYTFEILWDADNISYNIDNNLLTIHTDTNHIYNSPLPVASQTYVSTGSAVIDWVFLGKYIAGLEPRYNCSSTEVDFSSAGFDDGNILIPILNDKDISVKSMIEQNSFDNNEEIIISLISTEGEITNLIFTLNESYNYRVRFEFSIKKALNIFRLVVSNEYQVQIFRKTVSFIISKNIVSLKILLCNYTQNSKLNIFFLNGNLDYSIDNNWIKTETTKDSIVDEVNPFQVKITTSGSGGFKVLNTSYFKAFSAFQFLRTYLAINFKEVGTTYLLSLSTIHSTITINIENLTIVFRLEYQYDDDGVDPSYIKSYVELYDNAISKHEPSLSFIGGFGFASGGSEAICKIVAWRTVEDNIALAYGSNNHLFESLYGEQSTEDKLNIFLYDARELSNFRGNITINHYIRLFTTGDLSFTYTLDQCEYIFTSDFGIAQPHFSSTWFGIFPFNIISDWLLGTFTSGLDLPEWAVDFFDIFTGVGEAVADFLAPAFTGVVDVMTSVWGSIIDIGSNIVVAVADLFTDISNNILSWGQDVVEWIIDVLATFAEAIADFLIWFVNGIGALFGIANLADSIAAVIVNFGTAILNFIGGIVLVFSIVIDGFAFIVSIITTYLPTALTVMGIIIMMHVGLSFASMDDKVIMDMVGIYAKIFEKVLGILYSVANMVIQFIGGIIP